MKAAVLYEPNTPFKIEDVTMQGPQAGEVQIRIGAAGVCHSDYHVVTGDLPAPLPAILGHEGAGVVEAVGEGVKRVKPGDHVVMIFRAPCGHCEFCQKGKPGLCIMTRPMRASGRMMDGTSRYSIGDREIKHFCGISVFAEQSIALEEAIVPIPADVPMEIAAVVGCAVMTGVGAVINTARVEPGSTVLVIGAGGVGLSCVMGAQLAGAARIIVADTVDNKLEMALDFGATDTLNPKRQPTPEAVLELTGEGVDYAFEAIGNGKTMTDAYRSLRRGGTAVAVGVAPPSHVIEVSAVDLVFNEKTLKGSFYGSTRPQADMPKLLNLYRAGKLPLDKFISRRYPLDQINEAYQAMLSGEVARSVLVPS